MEAAQKKLDFLKGKLEDSIKLFGSKRQSSKARAFGIKIIALFLSVSTTIVLGLEGLGHPTAIKNAALFLSAVVTLLTAWEAFFNHRAMWIRYTMTYTSLLELQVDLEYLIAGGIENVKEADVDKLNDRRRAILQETNNYWIDLRKEDKPTGDT